MPAFASRGRKRNRSWAWARSLGSEVVLAKPQTMMNLSGLAVRELVSRAECEPSDVIVVCDDIALPWGMLRVRERGTAGGHNGLKSVIGALGTTEFVRVRLGVKPEEMRGDLKEYVLRQIRRDEEDLVGRGNRAGRRSRESDLGGRNASRDEPLQSPRFPAGRRRNGRVTAFSICSARLQAGILSSWRCQR